MESEAVSFSNGTNSWETLIAALNCSTADEIACARAAPASTIKSIIEHGALSFGPVVDGTTRAENVTEAIVSGTAADIPILIGSNANEGSAFAAAYGNLSTFLAVAFPSAPAAYLEEVTAAYPRSIYPTDLDIISQINTEVTFQCAAATIANLTTARGLPVYRYYYNGTFPNTQPFPGAGAFHSSEISEVFGTYNKTGATTQEITLSNYMKTAWANFAKNPEAQPQPSWPRIGSTSKDLLTLQSSGRGGGPAVVQYNLDFRCQLYAPVYQATGL